MIEITDNKLSGIIDLYKPAGSTSFSAAAAVRRLTGVKKCGHGGTLDPEATGVLPVLLGKATRLSDVFLGMHKTYEARLRFGASYDTGDVWGMLTETAGPEQEARVAALKREEIVLAAAEFIGRVIQVPPAYSALKIGGVPAYKLARRGEVPELKPRAVNIYGIEVGALTDGPEGREVALRVECGRGTYIRTLCCDIAAALGLPGAMSALCRTSYGPLGADNAVTPEMLAAAAENGAEALEPFILPCETVLGGFRRVDLGCAEAEAYLNGRPVRVENTDGAAAPASEEPVTVRVYGPSGDLFGLGTVRGGNLRGKVSLR